MNQLTANLKTLYQWRMLWLFHIIFIGIYAGIATSGEIRADDYSPLAGIMFMHFAYGIITASLLIRILHKPLTFCLSTQTDAARKMLLTVWLSLMVLFLLVFGQLLYEISGHNIPLEILFAGIISLSYWAGVLFIWPKKHGFLPLIIFAGFLFFIIYKNRPGNYDAEMTTYIFCPYDIFFACIILSLYVYYTTWDKDKIRKLRTIPAAAVRLYSKPDVFFSDRAAGFFAKHISAGNNSMLKAGLWSQIYLITGPLLMNRKKILLFVIWYLFILFKTFIETTDDIGSQIFKMAILIMFTMFFSITFNKRTDHYLLIERREYFLRGIMILTINFLLLIFIFSASILINNLFSETFTHTSWCILFAPAATLPIFGGTVVFFRKDNSPALIASMVVAFLVSLGISFWLFKAFTDPLHIASMAVILSAMILTWGGHIAVLYYDSMKRSLC